MADGQHNLDDPRWTAFVLGELEAGETERLADCLAADPLLRRRIDELRETAELLRLAFDAERDDLPPAPNKKLRDATRRAAQQMSVRTHGDVSPVFPPARTRATRAVVALASLAMVAVTLLVTTVTPNRLPDTTPSIPVAPASVTWTEHFVWNTYNDADGIERINLAFRLTGDESIGDLQRDFGNGLNYVSLSVDNDVQRMYVAENDFAEVTELSDVVSGESLPELRVEALTDEAEAMTGPASETELLRQLELLESTVDFDAINRGVRSNVRNVEQQAGASDGVVREPPMSSAGLAGDPVVDRIYFQESLARRFGGSRARYMIPTPSPQPVPEQEALVAETVRAVDAYGVDAPDSPAAGGFGGGGVGEGRVSWGFVPPNVTAGATTWTKFLSPLSSPVSEFPVSNADSAYQIVAEYLDNGFLPPAESVYVDDFVNQFAVPPPVTDPSRPIHVTIEAAACPWQPRHRLARVTVSARPIAPNERPPVALVAVVDTSESMQTNGRLETVEAALSSLSNQLTEHDRLSLVTDEVLELEAREGRAQEAVRTLRQLGDRRAFDELRGLRLGFDIARRQYLNAGLNHILFCTDGALGSDPMTQEELLQLVEQQSDSNLSVNLNGLGIQPHSADRPALIGLVDAGQGVYAEVDANSPVPKEFFAKILGADATVAEHVDIQVSFNPLAITAYRRIGSKYDDASVAEPAAADPTFATLTAGTSITSLYEFVPRTGQADDDPNRIGRAVWQRLNQDSPMAANVQVRRMNDRVTIDGVVATEQHKRELERSVAALYRKPELIDNRVQVVESQLPNRGPAINDSFTVHVKYRQPETGAEVRFDQVFVDDGNESPSPELKWAGLVAEFGLMLENPASLADESLERVLTEVQSSAAVDDASRQQLAELVTQSRVTHEAARQAGTSTPLSPNAGAPLFSVGGKYAQPVGQITAPQDAAWYGTFYDFGRWDGGSYAGQGDLPPAYWVYVYPNWYIWGDTAPQPAGDANE